ncbi:hypothetical protein EJ04DRAFT_462876 [Polyplosphaeria fusca]|uniref:FabD/lysophospholipase-like protein n=1 Tax=Polyplosphaeria fusca TaxID=682080 RepID=A0A9P4R4W1_9PLEO|nr:hypothetical protein EJ04DRAFT_462876 [Polyplosphaeria fusca]
MVERSAKMSSSLFRKPSEKSITARQLVHPTHIPVSRASSSTVAESAVQESRAKSFVALPRSNIVPQLPLQETIACFKTCEACDLSEPVNGPIWNCSYCDMNICDSCWGRQGPHRPGRTGPDGLPHEKGDPDIVARLKSILTPPKDVVEQQSLHIDDEDTTWFGIGRDNGGLPIFQDYGRYANIIADSTAGTHKLRYPQLVSFIGQTGAGKSTLVKMLIDQQERRSQSFHERNTFASPVVGSMSHENVPTSGDVHLYADPHKHLSEFPLLYADCEGLEGGEGDPMSLRRGQLRQNIQKRHRLAKVSRGTQRDIKWADSPEKSKRQYAVTELYPRLLYTFSDVVVFVLRNSKTFESSVLSKLINWASASMEKSLNQPTLPHAIIALNATDMEVHQNEWETDYATDTLMAAIAEAIHQDLTYRHLAEYWISRGKQIRTTKDLLECYYSSITVVRIPVKGRYMKIDEQISKLHNVLCTKSSESFKAKRRSRMLSNAEELNVYLQCAFDHFSRDLDTPFNFMDIAFRMNPIPQDFGGNILKLAVATKSSNRFADPGHVLTPELDWEVFSLTDYSRNMFRELSLMVASCILLDCVRQNLKGPAEEILEKAYMDFCDTALEDFCAMFWPCGFSGKGGRCVNAQIFHQKGHQNEKGKIIGTGPYQSDFTWEVFADDWLRHLQSHLADFQAKVHTQLSRNASLTELLVTTDLHHANINVFYQRLGGAQKFVSHSVCLCCLRELPEHPLPCGHVLCTPCIKGYGRPSESITSSYSMASCPLHEEDSTFPSPSEVIFKPTLAGVRVLSLDGGGIRGIVLLEVLRNIEEELGKCIPIQDFFDLIVGTSTGGILALGLGIKNWSVDHTMTLFLKLVDKAFTPKLGGRMIGKRKYRTRPLEDALMDCFKDEPIFGGSHEDSANYARKVAVTAAYETGEQAVIFTNYNRAEDDQISYRLERPDDPVSEIKLWEAARATSAAPTFFRPFVNLRTKEGYLDGAVFHNNPVRIANYESKLIWPEVEEYPPDILLSIGTGHNGSDTDGSVETLRLDRRRLHTRAVLSKEKPEDRQRSSTWRPFPEVNSWINVVLRRLDNILDSESIWRDFKKDVTGTSSHVQSRRYIRMNPHLRFRTPKMDDKSQVQKLHDEVKSRLQTPSMRAKITSIAFRLVASSFYFAKFGPLREVDDQFIVHGTILCRFARGSQSLRNLGDYLKKHQFQSFQPFFNLQESTRRAQVQRIPISPKVISEMTEFGFFDIGPISIPISSRTITVSIDMHLSNGKNNQQSYAGFPISGFPRSLDDVESLNKSLSAVPLEPENLRIAQRRQSVRHRRTVHSGLSHDRVSSISSLDPTASPIHPQDVNDWTERRAKAKRAQPKPLSLAGGSLELEQIETGDRVDSPWDEDDTALTKALQRSEQKSFENVGHVEQNVGEEEGDNVQWSDMFVLRHPIRE